MTMQIAVIMFLLAQVLTLIDCKIKKSWVPLIILYVVMINVYNMAIAYFLYGV